MDPAAESPLASFAHDPLPDSASYIRLIEITQGNFDQHVVCELSVYPLRSVPPYYAISYTWGDPPSTANITINGKHMLVRQNCEYVLQQAYASKRGKYFWVDAICIDQESVQEKNHQVAMMGQIYQGAAHVFACMGPHSDDSEFIMETCNGYKDLLENIATRDPQIWSVSSYEFNPIRLDVRLMMRCSFVMNRATRARLSEALFTLMQRPYLARVWILQELFMASKVSYCCGPDMQPFDRLLGLSWLVCWWLRLKNRSPFGSYVPIIIPLTFHIISSVSVLTRRGRIYGRSCSKDKLRNISSQMFCLSLASRYRRPCDLDTLLDRLTNFYCADVRDKLYGILHLVGWGESLVPAPDYTKNTFEIATEVLGILLGNFGYDLREMPALGPLVWTSRLWRLFDMSSHQALLEGVLNMRRAPSSTSRAPAEGGFNTICPDLEWCGTQLCSPSFKPRSLMNITLAKKDSKESSYLRCSEDPSEEGIVDIVNHNGAVYAHASGQTREGDWLLECLWTEGEVISRTGFIVRASEDDRFNIIGTIWKLENDKKYIRSCVQKPVELWWHPEDLLTLAWAWTEFQPQPQIIAEWLRWPVCSFEGSSYATMGMGQIGDGIDLRTVKRPQCFWLVE